MWQTVDKFLKRTGIRPETFGRLTLNDPDLVFRLRRTETLDDEEWGMVLMFMQHYDEFKGW